MQSKHYWQESVISVAPRSRPLSEAQSSIWSIKPIKLKFPFNWHLYPLLENIVGARSNSKSAREEDRFCSFEMVYLTNILRICDIVNTNSKLLFCFLLERFMRSEDTIKGWGKIYPFTNMDGYHILQGFIHPNFFIIKNSQAIANYKETKSNFVQFADPEILWLVTVNIMSSLLA